MLNLGNDMRKLTQVQLDAKNSNRCLLKCINFSIRILQSLKNLAC